MFSCEFLTFIDLEDTIFESDFVQISLTCISDLCGLCAIGGYNF